MNETKPKPPITTIRVSRKVADSLKRAATKNKSNLFPFSDKVILDGLKARKAQS